MERKTVFFALFSVLCALAGVFVGAGISMYPDFTPNFEGRCYMPQPQGQMKEEPLPERLLKKLYLNQEQQIAARDILRKARLEINKAEENIRNFSAGIREKGTGEIMAILTPEQQEKFKAMLQETGR